MTTLSRTHLNALIICIAIGLSSCQKSTDKRVGDGLKDAPQQQTNSHSIPHLSKQGDVIQLIVDDKPYLMLAGELHNSSSSSIDYIRKVWPKLDSMSLNTVLAAVQWDLLEPEEGKYNFAFLDELIQQARKYNMRLVVLWFGSWKNGISHYAPDWVKKDFRRFPRVRIYNGKSIEVLSTLSKESREADARAYVAMMRHIRETDSAEHTVVMIQMQNEVGILGDSRDRSDAANIAFASQVPRELMDYLQKHDEMLLPALKKIWKIAGSKPSGTWQEVFGKSFDADELFMAWNYAQYLNHITKAGKKELPIPVFVNAWIVQPEDKKPGDYPSGGPQGHVHDIWRAGAPDIDILAPDIYLPNFEEICVQYIRNGNPLLVPESRAGEDGAANAFFAFGQAHAIGYSPFGIDNRVGTEVNGPIPRSYRIFNQLSPIILEAQTKGTIRGFSLDQKNDGREIKLGGYKLNVELKRDRSGTKVTGRAYGLIISTGVDEFIVAGKNIQVTFFPDSPGPAMAGIGSLYEGKFEKGQWVTGRKLNGDNIMLDYHLDSEAAANRTGSVVRIQKDESEILKVRLYRFE